MRLSVSSVRRSQTALRRAASCWRAVSITAALLALFSANAFSAQQTAVDRYRADQIKADDLYKAGKHEEALQRYLKLAKKGDLFSQYRVSYMYYAAEGTEQDWPDAYAWATLAAQTHIPQFVEYREALAANVPDKKRRAATRRADYYYRKWGNLALVGELQRSAKRELRECTGSRLGTRCEDVYAAQMPNAWNISPGPGSGGAGSAREAELGGSASGSGSRSTQVAGAGGGDGRDIDYYQSLRKSIADLDQYIRSQTGTVEIGELEVLEPEPAGQEGTEGSR